MNARTGRLLLLIALVGLIAVVGLTGCTTKVVSAPSGTPTNSVTASGSGKVAAAPDEATMSFGVTAQASDPEKALDEASATAEKITAAVVAEGVDKKDIQTTNVSVYPQQDQNGTITGYQANLTVTVKLTDMAKVGEVISAANAAGANSINGPTFGIGDDSEYSAQSTEKAVDDARRNAEAMAKAAGRSVGEVIAITGSNVNVPGPVMFDAARAESAGAVPVEPGQLDVTSDVTVVFELK